MRNLLIVLSGPSGVGKGTIVDRLMQSGEYALSISCTTRPPRGAEKEGVHYFFTDKQSFLDMVQRGGFLEYSEHFGCYYGTPKKFVEQTLKTHNVILEIDVDGALQVKKAHKDAVLFMIAPPSLEELKARLIARGTEPPEDIEKRLSRADYELSFKDSYDYVVVNDDIDAAVREIEDIIKREKEKQV